MPVKPQNFQNHVRFIPTYHLVLSLLLLANLGYWVLMSGRHGLSGLRLDGLIVAAALLLLFFHARQFALTVQDRVIRLEMRLRLERLLPPELMARFGDLTPAQLVALRFAGDGELPDLVSRVLAGGFESTVDIKKAIRDWQPDWLRA
jgi:hypothetical protein